MKSSAKASTNKILPFFSGTLLVFLLFWSLNRAFDGVFPTKNLSNQAPSSAQEATVFLHGNESLIPLEQLQKKFNSSFSLGRRIRDWDERRSHWLKTHQKKGFAGEKIFLVTSSDPRPCENEMGDYLLLKSAKNKMDYCRIHGIEIFYNVATLEPDLPGFWVKLPLIRATMLAHPESEWIWWVDSDALFTDMSFRLPLHKYQNYNLVLHGWDHLIYQNKSWVGLNMGIFLIRNCQWSLDLLDVLASMGNSASNREYLGIFFTQILADRPVLESDDQGALIYLILAERQRWGAKIFLEHDYHLSGFWIPLVYDYEENMRKYRPGFGDNRWPFITHFAGCEVCSGRTNQKYSAKDCRKQMERAFNFADNQVLKSFGFTHQDLGSNAVQHLKY